MLQGNDKQIDTGMLVHKSSKAKSIHRNVSFRRVLYLDIDIHHGDGVQEAFYATDKVLTASFHRYSPGFFPSSTGSTTEKGEAGTSGLGYNVNIPLPAGIGDEQFIQIYRKCLFGLVKAYDPQAIVLCVGADGLEGDELISGCLDDDMTTTGDGWSLSPEGLAECVRIATALCAGQSEDEICVAPTTQMQQEEEKESEDDTPVAESSTKKTEAPKQSGKRRKLLILGGGGYVSLKCSCFWTYLFLVYALLTAHFSIHSRLPLRQLELIFFVPLLPVKVLGQECFGINCLEIFHHMNTFPGMVRYLSWYRKQRRRKYLHLTLLPQQTQKMTKKKDQINNLICQLLINKL